MTLVFGKYFYLPIGEVIVTSAVFSCGWKPHKFFFPETLQEAGDFSFEFGQIQGPLHHLQVQHVLHGINSTVTGPFLLLN